MVPDDRLIAGITTFAFGCGDAWVLGNKVAQVYQLEAEQLPTQKNSDLGMRAVKTGTAATGQLSRHTEVRARGERLLWVAVSAEPDGMQLLKVLHYQLTAEKMAQTAETERDAMQASARHGASLPLPASF